MSGSRNYGGGGGVGGDEEVDPEIVSKIVDELKSCGTFDQFRKEFMAQVDMKPAYQNLRQRVDASVKKFLDQTTYRPDLNKIQLRNQLRKHLEDSGILDSGVRRIVDQVMNHKIISQIAPEVENAAVKILGITKEEMEERNEDNDVEMEDAENGNAKDEEKPDVASDEKLSNISSEEDVEMKSIDLNNVKKDSSSMSSPGLTDKMSPLTPDGAQKSPVCEGNVSPLTPPPRPLPSEFDIHEPPPPGLEVVEEQVVEERPYSPKTPPLPPPNILPPPPPPQLEMDDSMSPVSDTEFANISPPAESPETPKSSDNNIIPSPPPMTPPPLPPSQPPPPPPSEERPPSPITSPIISSPDLPSPSPPPSVKKDEPKSGPSDISDADLPASSDENVDVEELEKARAKILAEIAAAANKSSTEDEGEIPGSGDSSAEEYRKKFDKILLKGPDDSELSDNNMTSPVLPPHAGSSSSEDEKDKKKKDDHESSKNKKPGDKTPSDDDAPKEEDNKKSGESSSTNESKLKSREERTSTDDKEKRRSSKDGNHKTSKSHHRRERNYSSDSKSESFKNKTGKKEENKNKAENKTEKNKEKLERIEQKVNKAFKLKSDKFKDVDMFAPKPPKPKPVLHRPPSANGRTPPSFGSKTPPTFGSKTPPAFGHKTPPSFGHKTPPAFGHETPTSSKNTPTSKTPKEEKKSENDSKPVKKEIQHERITDQDHKKTPKVYPKFPVSKPESGVDKAKQHEDDVEAAKNRLNEMKLKLAKQKDDKKKSSSHHHHRKSSSSSSNHKSSSSSSKHRRSSHHHHHKNDFKGFSSDSLKKLGKIKDSLDSLLKDEEKISITEDEIKNCPPFIPDFLTDRLNRWKIPISDVKIHSVQVTMSSNVFSADEYGKKRKLEEETGNGRSKRCRKPTSKSNYDDEELEDEEILPVKEESLSVKEEETPVISRRLSVRMTKLSPETIQQEMNKSGDEEAFHGFETPPRVVDSELKSLILKSNFYAEEMKEKFISPFDSSDFNVALNLDDGDDVTPFQPLKNVFKFVIRHNSDEYLLPLSPSTSHSSDDKEGSSSPSSSKENENSTQKKVVTRKSRASTKIQSSEKTAVMNGGLPRRTRRSVPSILK